MEQSIFNEAKSIKPHPSTLRKLSKFIGNGKRVSSVPNALTSLYRGLTTLPRQGPWHGWRSSSKICRKPMQSGEREWTQG